MQPELLETAVFGKQVENFLEGDIGKYLVKRAEEQAEESIEKLKHVNPWSIFARRKVQELQNKIWVAESIQQWLADAVIDGLQATNLLEEESNG